MINSIQEMIDLETRGWNEKSVDILTDLFHPDMVWSWPSTAYDHNPIHWEIVLGRFSKDRWAQNWQTLFDTHTLVHNNRYTKKITLSKENDGAIAIVDIDTLWRNNITGKEFHWYGRTCKTYVKLDCGWKMINQTGALIYN